MGDELTKRPYIVPTKQVKSIDDMMRWEKSEAYQVSTMKALCEY